MRTRGNLPARRATLLVGTRSQCRAPRPAPAPGRRHQASKQASACPTRHAAHGRGLWPARGSHGGSSSSRRRRRTPELLSEHLQHPLVRGSASRPAPLRSRGRAASSPGQPHIGRGCNRSGPQLRLGADAVALGRASRGRQRPLIRAAAAGVMGSASAASPAPPLHGCPRAAWPRSCRGQPQHTVLRHLPQFPPPACDRRRCARHGLKSMRRTTAAMLTRSRTGGTGG